MPLDYSTFEERSSSHSSNTAQGRMNSSNKHRLQLFGYDIPIFTPVIAAYGILPVGLIVFSYLFIKGILYSVQSSITTEVFQLIYPQTASRYTRFVSLTHAGSALKSGLGVLVNFCPLFGYRRRYWFIITVIGMTFSNISAFVVLMLSGVLDDKAGGALFTCMLFLTSMFSAWMDILTEATWAVMIFNNKATGADLVSTAWMFQSIGSAIGATIVGTMGDANLIQWVLLILVPVTLAPAIPTIWNWAGENPMSYETDLHSHADFLDDLMERDEVDADPEPVVTIATNHYAVSIQNVIRLVLGSPLRLFDLRHVGELRALTSFAILMSLIVVSNVLFGLIGTSSLAYMLFVVLTSVPLQFISFLSLPATVAASNIYIFLKLMTYLPIYGPINLFYTAKNLPNGPHLSFVLYQTVGAVLSGFGSFVGAAAFSLCFSKHSWKLTYFCTTTMRLIASAFDILVTSRYNLRIHLSDKLCYLLGDNVIYLITLRLDYMPAVLLISRFCPARIEILMYATLAGAENLGGTVAGSIGPYLISLLGIEGNDKTGVFTNFDKIPLLVFIAHMLVPAVIIYPLTFFLVPSGRLDGKTDLTPRSSRPNDILSDESPNTQVTY